jgi:gas vesicle protein
MHNEQRKAHHKAHHKHHEIHHEHEERHHRRGRSPLQWFRGFLVGSTTGLLLSLLVAPQSGRETREYLRYKSHQLKQTAEQTVEEAREKAEHLSQDARLQMQTLQQRGRNYVEEQKDRVNRVAAAVKETWKEEAERDREADSLRNTETIRTTM